MLTDSRVGQYVMEVFQEFLGGFQVNHLQQERVLKNNNKNRFMNPTVGKLWGSSSSLHEEINISNLITFKM